MKLMKASEATDLYVSKTLAITQKEFAEFGLFLENLIFVRRQCSTHHKTNSPPCCLGWFVDGTWTSIVCHVKGKFPPV